MGAAEAIEVQADYAIKGPDYETLLIGGVCESIVDADRLVRCGYYGQPGWANGFPNWELYRAVYCGDHLPRQRVRDWCVAYAIAYCEGGGVRKGQPAEEIGCLAGWDAYYALMNHKWVIAGMDVADVAGVDPKTYRKVRNHVYAAQMSSLREYWELLNIAIRQVVRMDREVEAVQPRGRWQNGRGFAHEVGFPGDGCYIVKPAKMSDYR